MKLSSKGRYAVMALADLAKFNSNEPLNCLKIFKSNNQFGLLIFINLIIEKVQI